jgi:hypothetical protein
MVLAVRVKHLMRSQLRCFGRAKCGEVLQLALEILRRVLMAGKGRLKGSER